jgi:hypothetical protein
MSKLAAQIWMCQNVGNYEECGGEVNRTRFVKQYIMEKKNENRIGAQKRSIGLAETTEVALTVKITEPTLPGKDFWPRLTELNKNSSCARSRPSI